MKICIVSNLYSPYGSGGAELTTEKLAVALSDKENVFVITSHPFSGIYSLFPKLEIKDKIRIFRFYPLNLFYVGDITKRKISIFVKIIWRIIDMFNLHTFFVVFYILKKEKPDVIHSSNLGGLSFSVFWVAKLLNIPLLHTLHDFHLICPYAGYLICPYTKFKICKNRPFPCRAYSFLKKIIVDDIPKVVIGPSRFIIDMHKEYGFFRSSELKVIPNFIEKIERIHPLEFDKNELDFLYVGKVSREKGVEILIKAFKYLKEDFIKLHIVGDIPQRDKFLIQDLAKIDLRIKFYGKRNACEVREFYGFCDLLIVPSIWYENFPTVILEAFSYALPVVGSSLGGIPELIKDSYNGFLFSPANTEELNEKLRIIIEDFKNGKVLLKKMSNNALESARYYTKETILGRFLEVYKEAIK